MDGLNILLSILIPLIVSIIVWTFTYIIPYVYPSWLSENIIRLSKNDPKDPIEIGLIINQFSKYDDWKRLNAYKRIKRMFIAKIKEIEEKDEIRWSEKKKEKVINLPLKKLLPKLNLLITTINNENDDNNNISSGDVMDYFKGKQKTFQENQKDYSEILENNPKSIIWGECFISIENIKKYNKGNYILTTKEIELLDLNNTVLDKYGVMNVEGFLKTRGDYPPKIRKNEDIIAIFNEVMLYIDYPHSKSKKDELFYQLSLGLSDHEKSDITLNSLIGEVEIQPQLKDYKEFKRRNKL